MPEVKYNSDELVPPTFMDQTFISDMVKSIAKDPECKLISHDIKPGSAAGDHYASIMFKISAVYETQGERVSKRFVFKTMPESGEKKDFLDQIPIFDTEIKIYTTTLPYMEELLEKYGEKRVWPKMVYSSLSPPVIVFEDLTQEDFTMHYDLLKLEDLKMVLTRIAKYHAISMVIADSDKSELVTEYKFQFDPEHIRPLMQSMIDQGKGLGTAVKTWPGMKAIGEKMEANMDRVFTSFCESYGQKNTWGFNVLNHGDFHIRNMMFKKDKDGVIENITFLDYQMPLYSSPGFDLAYLLNTIADQEVRGQRFQMIRFYHSELSRFLQKFEFQGQVPSVVDVHVALMSVVAFDAFQITTMGPTFMIDLTGIELGDLFKKDGETPIQRGLQKLYQDEKFIKEMTDSLNYADGLGAFD